MNSELKFLQNIRKYELEFVLNKFDKAELKKLKLLEIGSGNGFQISILKNFFGSVTGIDITLNNVEENTNEISKYDGKHIPFGDKTFDFVFSSNTLEHIAEIAEFDIEIKRVLKDSGHCIHILPSTWWRLWTIVYYYTFLPLIILSYIFNFLSKSKNKQSSTSSEENMPKKTIMKTVFDLFFLPRHGEFGTTVSEIYFFSKKRWKKHFEQNNWNKIEHGYLKIFYLPFVPFTSRLFNENQLKFFSRIFGSVTHYFYMQK